MKAIVFDQYGPPEKLKLEEVPKPEPRAGDVLVKIRAASVNAADWHLMRADPALVRLMAGLRAPRHHRLGLDLAGTVEAVGDGVKDFKSGDEVFGVMKFPKIGSYAEYACAPEGDLALKPASMNFEEAAAAPLAGGTALQALSEFASVKPGMKVLVNGAAGGVGSFAVQIAKALGAEVTAVCSARNLEQSLALGAARAIDYQKEDFTQGSQRYDVVVAANGYHPLSAYRRVLAPGGVFVMTGGAGKQMAEAMFLGRLFSLGSGKKLGFVDHKPQKRYLLTLKELAEAGRLVSAIDRRYPLSQVPEAIAYLETGHARGKVVINVC